MMLGIGKPPPTLFLSAESAILIIFAALVFSYDSFAELTGRLMFASDGRRIARALAVWQRRGFPVAVSMAFVLQYVALTALLLKTGGPIESPFAQMILVFAVASVLLARALRTVIACVGLSLAYYSALVALYGYGPSEGRSDPGIYVAVTTLVLALAVGLVVLERLEVSRSTEPGSAGDNETSSHDMSRDRSKKG
jgi:hypothetical protein